MHYLLSPPCALAARGRKNIVSPSFSLCLSRCTSVCLSASRPVEICLCVPSLSLCVSHALVVHTLPFFLSISFIPSLSSLSPPTLAASFVQSVSGLWCFLIHSHYHTNFSLFVSPARSLTHVHSLSTHPPPTPCPSRPPPPPPLPPLCFVPYLWSIPPPLSRPCPLLSHRLPLFEVISALVGAHATPVGFYHHRRGMDLDPAGAQSSLLLYEMIHLWLIALLGTLSLL